jgi:hypothetical protein
MIVELVHEEDDIEEKTTTDDIVSQNIDVEKTTFSKSEIGNRIDNDNTEGGEEEHSSSTFLHEIELEDKISHEEHVENHNNESKHDGLTHVGDRRIIEDSIDMILSSEVFYHAVAATKDVLYTPGSSAIEK